MTIKGAFRTTVKLSLLAFAYWLCHCDHFSEHATDQHVTEMRQDTSLLICSEAYEMKMQHQRFIELEDFEAFANSYCDKPLYFENEELIDTTGDGNAEVVRTTVEMVAAGCKVRNTISSNGQLLWEDEMMIDDVHGGYLFGESGNYDRLYPFSAFYLGIVNAPFIDDLNPMGNDFDFRKKYFLNKLAKTDDPGQLQKAHDSPLANYIDEYKGKYIFRLGMTGRDIFMWDPFKKAFVPFYLS